MSHRYHCLTQFLVHILNLLVKSHRHIVTTWKASATLFKTQTMPSHQEDSISHPAQDMMPRCLRLLLVVGAGVLALLGRNERKHEKPSGMSTTTWGLGAGMVYLQGRRNWSGRSSFGWTPFLAFQSHDTRVPWRLPHIPVWNSCLRDVICQIKPFSQLTYPFHVESETVMETTKVCYESPSRQLKNEDEKICPHFTQF